MRTIYYGYWIILAGFITQFVAVGMANYVVGSFLIPMTQEFGWSRAEFTAARSIGQVIFAITGFVIGTSIDRYGGRPFILGGGLLLSASLFILGHIETLTQWLLVNGLMLTTGSAMIGNLVVNVTLGKWFVEQRGKAVALAGMGISLAGILLPLAATWLVDTFGWRESWRLLGLGALLLTLPAALVVRRCPEDHDLYPDGRTSQEVEAGLGEAARQDYERSMTRREAMRTSSFYLLVLAFGLFQISVAVMLTQTIPLMTDAGYSRLVASSMITLASIPAFLSKPLWGILIDKFSPRRLAAYGAAITGAGVMLIVIGISRNLDLLVYGSFLLMGVGWGGLLPLQEVIWASIFGRRYLGSIRSTAMPFTFGLSAIGPLLVAWYHDVAGSYNLALLIIAACNLASAVMLYRIRDAAEPESSPAQATEKEIQ